MLSNMKKVRDINMLLLLSLVILAVISFGPCIKVYAINIIRPVELLEPIRYKGSLSYSPFFFCTISLIEIALIIVSNRRAFRLIGMIMHILKMLFPITLYRMGVFWSIGEAYKYTFSWVGYVLLALGIVILILYGFDFIKNGRRLS